MLVHVTVKHLGQRYDFPLEGHYWRFGPDGKVIAFDHVVDTALMVRMARGE